jgi:hypothetical protein
LGLEDSTHPTTVGASAVINYQRKEFAVRGFEKFLMLRLPMIGGLGLCAVALVGLCTGANPMVVALHGCSGITCASIGCLCVLVNENRSTKENRC